MSVTNLTGVRSAVTRRRDWLFWATYLVASAAILASYASLFRPLWIDEAIHFVLAGQSSLGELLLRLHNPDAGFLTRQTGFYQVLNYVTLQATGANWVALRLPSILSGVLMIWALYTFLRERGASRIFQFIGLATLAAQAGFMYYVGEARPYLPYAATTLGMLAFFTATQESQRKTSMKWLGWVSVYLGALFHLYFLLVLPVVLAYSVWLTFFLPDTRPSWARLWQALHPKLVGSAVVLALVLGWLTWMRPQETNKLDAFAWTGGTFSTLIDTVINFHLEFLPAAALRTSFIVAEMTLLLYLLVTRGYRRRRELFASALLIAAAFLTSVIIGGASIANDYAIANRQLVVGPLLTVAGIVWQVSVIAKASSGNKITARQALLGALTGLLYGALLIEINLRIPAIPMVLLILMNVVLAALLATARSSFHPSWRTPALVSVTAAIALLITALSMTTRLAPRWQALAALVLLTLLFAVVISVMAGRDAGKKVSVGSVVAVATLGCVIAVGLSTSASRVIIVRSEHYSQAALRAEVESLGPDELARLRTTGFFDAKGTDTDYGPGWVYLSNINVAEGGSIWKPFDGL